MPDDNNNDNEYVPVPELADQLGTTKPRLKRYLLLPEFAPHVKEIARTGPGPKTVTAVHVRVFADLKAALSSGNLKQEQKQTQALSLPTEVSELTQAYLKMLTARSDEMITLQRDVIEDQKRERAKLEQELKQERERVSVLTLELDRIKALPSVEARAEPYPLPPDPAESDATPKEGEVPAKKRPWWSRWLVE